MVALHPPAGGPGRVVPGRLVVLSCPPAICPHAEFAVAAALACPVSLVWADQPALPGTLQATLAFAAAPGTAALLAAGLRRLGPLRFEVVEGPGGTDGDAERYSYDADLGLHRTALSASGEVVVREGQLAALLASARGEHELAQGLRRLLGTAWDEALEPLRIGGEGAPVSWLRRTG